MPPTLLDTRINAVVERAVREIAAVIRAELEREQSAARAHTRSATMGRPRGKPAPRPERSAETGRKPHPHRSYTDADLEGVLALIASRPGIRGEEVQAAVGGDDRVVKKILARLRSNGRVETIGIKRAMRYTVPGAPAAAVPAKVTPEPAAPTVAATEAPARPAPKPSEPTIVDLVRADLAAAYEGQPVSPGRIAFRIKADPELVDATLTFLVKQREAQLVRSRGKVAYVPVRRG